MKDEKTSSNFASILLIVGLSIVYLSTLMPGVGGFGDSAKFQLIGKIWGIPHPTGYPTYTVLNGIWVRVWPWGSVAYKVNLLSAVFALLAAYIFYKLLRQLTLSPYIALVSAFFVGVTHTLWSQAIIAEVYTLNYLFIALTLLGFFTWHTTKQDNHLYLACLAYALSFGNHMSMVTFLPAIVYLVWATDKTVFFAPKKIATIVGIILLGISQYFFLIWRAADPTILYAETLPSSLLDIVAMGSGGPFRRLLFNFSWDELVNGRLPLFYQFLQQNYPYFLFIPALIGVALTPKKLRIFIILAIIGNMLFGLNYNVFDVYVFYIPTYILLGIGLAFFLQKMTTQIAISRWLFWLLPLLLLTTQWAILDQSDNVLDDLQAKAVVDHIGQNGVIAMASNKYSVPMHITYYLFGEARQEANNIFWYRYNNIEELASFIDGNPLPRQFQSGEIAPSNRLFLFQPDLNEVPFNLQPIPTVANLFEVLR